MFGNRGETSATGVVFTRNPSTGDKRLYGEFLVNAQGEDVVAGIRTPQNLTEAARKEAGDRSLRSKCSCPTLRRIESYLRTARSALPRYAGRRIHHPGGQALDAADAFGQAHHQGGAEDRGRHGGGRSDHARRRPCCASIRRSSISCCIRCSIRTPRSGHRRRACPPRRARQRAKSCSIPARPKSSRGRGEPSFWCAPKPARTTCTACMRPPAFSRRAAA